MSYFPLNPSFGDTFTTPDGTIWTWDDHSWHTAGNGGGGGLSSIPVSANSGSTITASGINFNNTDSMIVTVGSGTTGNANVSFVSVPAVTDDTPPASRKDGQFWWDSANGSLMIWYVDVDGGQWVDASPAIGTQGVQGAAGFVGSDGAQGTTGSQGAVGTNGTQGATGTQGSVGTQGTTGAGTQGATGTQGTTGAGTQGVQGSASGSSKVTQYNVALGTQTIMQVDYTYYTVPNVASRGFISQFTITANQAGAFDIAVRANTNSSSNLWLQAISVVDTTYAMSYVFYVENDDLSQNLYIGIRNAGGGAQSYNLAQLRIEKFA